MKRTIPIESIRNVAASLLMLSVNVSFAQSASHTLRIIHPLSLEQVRVNDQFWSPKLKVWDSKTVYDVFDKLEGKYEPDRKDLIDEKAKLGRTRNAFLNFDWVAQGKKNTGEHDGPPWYDGLVYETIRGAADLLVEYPDPKLEQKIDGYIDRIAAAQAADPDGYLNTYTTLVKPDQRWGTNGGDDKWQHDIYNAGMLIEAAVHYYKATGKMKLLDVATRFSNYIYQQIGPAPKANVIPGHGGPEEAILKLYWLFRDEPALKAKMSVPVDANHYYTMARFWIENRGNYGEKDGSHARKSDESYNQDHMSVFSQKTIEGHAVRATLLATGVAATALENKDDRYVETANNYWDNMIGKRMFITGGEGAIADGERFGANHFLPESAYLESCAAIGSAFFSQRMNQLEADGKYIDELERVLYNNLLSSVSLDGSHYFYENPLVASDHKRWAWHSCPCCPPMLLKMVSAMPGFIYAYDNDAIYVNLFIGSQATINQTGNTIRIRQMTQYPWKGESLIEVDPTSSKAFTVNVRIPGWAHSVENPFGLYHSKVSEPIVLKVNGKSIPVNPKNGYAAIRRTWKKGDRIELSLPMQPRVVTPNDSIQTIKGKVALASGPIIYGVEGVDNAALNEYVLPANTPLKLTYKPNLLNGVNVITGGAMDKSAKAVQFTAVPFYTFGNRGVYPYRVWLPKQ
ncbi:glycoside hydrolase family 127 protein [Spirosoma aerolatum]|uniref:glycoside hydrolase family 127 protein n=1 Tax=Spirosoma aerolatum TaxID=1211326 RepID=UPI0009AF0DFB|nr:beta-L-arabinofuranosidase domain-containing protein [Spirosoma aerolatum]